ncbi:MAG: carboxylating nicotinate-nucleotide diphosphorylase [Desulfobulbaceae bacterium]|jgi:nicotinate-nucleotide pyrophosphorylase (carboxylating)|nr:carboxylating nicotinate-nucleotide diphosphorylase [Desulfobulbaceae bacterium]
MDELLLDRLIGDFLAEDIGSGDVTTDGVLDGGLETAAVLQAREPLVAAGMALVAGRTFRLLNGAVVVEAALEDGRRAEPGEVVLRLRGPARDLLRGERVALNLAQRLCGIATLTSRYVDRVAGLKAQITDTRKTTPGLRMLEKYAVRVGGGRNHRFNLSDGVLIKDNHIAACGSISEAVERVRARAPHTLRIEVEAESLDQVRECLDCGVDIIMLDNMDVALMKEAVGRIGGRALVEASGGVTLETVRRIAETGVDFISVGRLTHSAPACDISMDM